MAKSIIKSVKNDSKVARSVEAVLSEANTLAKQRENFEQEELARSNKALYAILSSVYALFKKAVADKCLKETVLQMRDALKARGIKVQSNTNALTVFVRYVFNSDRKRAYNYASTLMAAAQAEVEPSMLAEFIESKNGVEECKKEFKKSDETKQREQALANASDEVIALLSTMNATTTVKLDDQSVDFSDGAKFAFIVARSVSGGKFELLRAVPTKNMSLQTIAVKALAKAYIEQQQKVLERAKEEKAKVATSKAAKSLTAKSASKMTLDQLEAA